MPRKTAHFSGLMGYPRGHHSFLLGLAVVGVVAIMSLLVADLHRELLVDSTDMEGCGGESSKGSGNNWHLRESLDESHHESMTPQAPLPNGTEAIGGLQESQRQVRTANEPEPMTRPEIVPSLLSGPGQSTPVHSGITGPGTSPRDQNLALGGQGNEPRLSQAQGGSGAFEDDRTKDDLSIPFFYSLKASQYDLLSAEQQQAVVSLQNQYVNYYHDWTQESSGNVSEWNDRMREFHLELVRRVGAATADQLTR